MDDTACPEPGYALQAEILDRTLIESTDELVEHVRVACPRGHRFLMPTRISRMDGPGNRQRSKRPNKVGGLK